MSREALLGDTRMSQRHSRRLGDRLFHAFEAACAMDNDCLAFCLLEGLMLELADRGDDRRHPQWKIDLIVQATLLDITRPARGRRDPGRKSAELIFFPQVRQTRRRQRFGSVTDLRSHR